MKRFKKFVMAFTVLAIVGAGSAVYASGAAMIWQKSLPV